MKIRMTKIAGMTLMEKIESDYTNLKKSLDHIVQDMILSDIEFSKLRPCDIIQLLIYYMKLCYDDSDEKHNDYDYASKFVQKYMDNPYVPSNNKVILAELFDKV